MRSYRVALTTSAEKELSWLPSKLITRILGRLEKLACNPRPSGCKKLVGGDKQWRIRIGDWRVVYEIDDKAKTVDGPDTCLRIHFCKDEHEEKFVVAHVGRHKTNTRS